MHNLLRVDDSGDISNDTGLTDWTLLTRPKTQVYYIMYACVVLEACCQWALLTVYITTLLFKFIVQKHIYPSAKRMLGLFVFP